MPSIDDLAYSFIIESWVISFVAHMTSSYAIKPKKRDLAENFNSATFEQVHDTYQQDIQLFYYQ